MAQGYSPGSAARSVPGSNATAKAIQGKKSDANAATTLNDPSRAPAKHDLRLGAAQLSRMREIEFANVSKTVPTWAASVAPPVPAIASSAVGEAPQILAPEEPTPRLQQPVVWNYWLDAAGAPDAKPHPHSAPLLKGSTGHLRFRLSLLDLAKLYEGIGTLKTAQELAQAIQEGAQSEADELNLTVLISPADEKKLRIAQDARRLSIKIDLKAVRDALNDPDSVPQIGDRPLEEVLSRTIVAQFGIDFDVLSAGPHQIGVAMMDASTGNPMQSFIAEVQTGVSWPDSLQLKANGQSLFSAKSPPFDLTLVLYGSKVDSSKELHAWLGARDAATGNYDFVSWTADISYSGLSLATEAFIAIEGSVETGAALKDAGIQLSNLVFNPLVSNSADEALASQKNVDNAQRARDMIVAAAQYEAGTKPPSMLVSIVGGADQELGRFASTVVPIGALGVSTGTDDQAVFLGERFSLALMLNGQPPAAGAACAPDWYMSVPDEDVQSAGALYDALTDMSPFKDRWTKDQWRPQPASLKDLKDWMGPGSSSGAAQSFVFAYLGHHDMGRLFLRDKTENNLMVGAAKRQFGGSSIAILNACSSAMREINDGTWIGRLAKRNVAATIATTSPISGHLAAAYMDCLSTVLMKTPELTVGQAHALTTQCLWSPEGGKPWGKRYSFSGSALKYLLVGNPFQRICAPSVQQARQP